MKHTGEKQAGGPSGRWTFLKGLYPIRPPISRVSMTDLGSSEAYSWTLRLALAGVKPVLRKKRFKHFRKNWLSGFIHRGAIKLRFKNALAARQAVDFLKKSEAHGG